MEVFLKISEVLSYLFLACYLYQIVYIPVSLLGKRRTAAYITLHEYAVLICARNEEKVIGDLLDSLSQQTYNREHFKVFVLADNCTDNTARIAEKHQATVYCRKNPEKVGKGYALKELMDHIAEDYGSVFDAYIVFDADNIPDKDFIREMNICFSEGHSLITGYRNSKNFKDSWISKGYALWYLKDTVLLNKPRYLLKNSAVITGTGFLFDRKTAEEINGWDCFLLTEDIEFSTKMILKGKKIAYCDSAVFYDEQPTDFKSSVSQRLRWCKGQLQVMKKYGKRLIKKMFTDFSCFDLTMSIMPAYLMAVFEPVFYLIMGFYEFTVYHQLTLTGISFLKMLFASYSIVFLLGVITVISEYSRIKAGIWDQICSVFILPIFMLTYVPIAVMALFQKVEWKPIEHKVTLQNLRKDKLWK